MARFHFRSVFVLGALALSLASSVSGVALAADATPSASAADFACHGLVAQTCHFAVVRQTGSRMDFALASGQTRRVADVAVGVDRYMVAINFAPPQALSACSRTPASGKRSAWCKAALVGQSND